MKRKLALIMALALTVGTVLTDAGRRPMARHRRLRTARRPQMRAMWLTFREKVL